MLPVTRPSIRLTAVMLFAALLVAAGAGFAAWKSATADLSDELDQSLIVTARAIESEIERFRSLPKVIGEDARVRAAVARPGDVEAIEAANAYLERVASLSGVAELYVLDRSGTALAASNHARPGSFVGNNYGFRPYFRDALATGEGRYYAIGVTTGRPGYFLASRFADGDGIAVAKVDLGPLEAAWEAAGQAAAIADRYGVVFLSGTPAWRYRPLSLMDGETLDRIGAERTYDGIDLAAASPLLEEGGTVAQIAGARGSRMLARMRGMEPDGWRVVAAAPTGRAKAFALFWALVAGLSGILLTGLVRFLQQRRLITQLQARQTEVLERRVLERTEDLNREIDIRRKAEADLRAAQEGLIHSAKMAALGRMASAIVHEVSQPLAALESSLAGAEVLARREKADGAAERVTGARGLIRRMQRTVKHLKGFARKEEGTLVAVNLDEAIRNALDVAAPRARTAGAQTIVVPGEPVPPVQAVAVRIEQVLVNLIVNAYDAVDGRDAACVEIARSCADGIVTVAIADNGPGIAPEHRERIKEPFFSTKLSGEGMGLGLSISTAISQEYGGNISFEPRPGGGTVASLTLPASARSHAIGKASEAAE